MDNAKTRSGVKSDKIDGSTIIIYDNSSDGSQIIRRLKIITLGGEVREYQLKRTANVKYLLN